MGIINKLMFWKKKDEFADLGIGEKENLAFGDEFGSGNQPQDFQYPGLGQQYPTQNYPKSMGFPNQPQFQQQFQPRFETQQDITSKNLEVISSKIDALRAAVESVNQRLANLEAIARGEEEQKRRRGYY